MIVGFNHNVLYLGVGFHVQTEDGGLKSPSLVTLLYHGGIIVSSQKTSYADILGVDNLNQVVEDLAKEQHKGMLRRLTKGEFDQKIRDLGIAIEGDSAAAPSSSVVEKPAPEEVAAPVEPPAVQDDSLEAAPSSQQDAAAAVAEEVSATATEESEGTEELPAQDEPEEEVAEQEAAEEAPIAEPGEPWLGEALEELEPVPLELPVIPEPEPEPQAEQEVLVAAQSSEPQPPSIEPAYEPPSAEDRDTRQDVSEALDDLIFSYLTGGNEKP